jgi:hypothetical protein
MDEEINTEALAGLTAAIESLLEDVVDPPVQLSLLVTPTHISPTGLGGFVGINEDPQGRILGRRLQATALVSVSASDVGSLNEAVVAVTSAFLGADRGSLLEKGILRVGLDDIGPRSTSGSGSNMREERALTFSVLYEFLKRPDESEGIILEVPINLDTT